MSKKSKLNGRSKHAPPAAPTISWDDAVAEAKTIVTTMNEQERRNQLRLGELADKVLTRYADRSLKKFADAIGIVECTLERYRSVYRDWDGAGISAPGPISYSVMRALQSHPDREAIVRNNPNITKSKALTLMREHKTGGASNKRRDESSDGRRDEYRRWLREASSVANAAERVGGFVGQFIAPEHKRILLECIEPDLVPAIRKGGEALVQLADYLDQLAGERPPLAQQAEVSAEQRASEMAALDTAV